MMKTKFPLQIQHIWLFEHPALLHSARSALVDASILVSWRCFCSHCCYCHCQTPSKWPRKLADMNVSVKTEPCQQLFRMLAGRSISIKDLNVQIKFRSQKLCDPRLKWSSWWFVGILEGTQGTCSEKIGDAEAWPEFAWWFWWWVPWSWWRWATIY